MLKSAVSPSTPSLVTCWLSFRLSPSSSTSSPAPVSVRVAGVCGLVSLWFQVGRAPSSSVPGVPRHASLRRRTDTGGLGCESVGRPRGSLVSILSFLSVSDSRRSRLLRSESSLYTVTCPSRRGSRRQSRPSTGRVSTTLSDSSLLSPPTLRCSPGHPRSGRRAESRSRGLLDSPGPARSRGTPLVG